MKTYLIHHTPTRAGQDTWAVWFSLPYIAAEYARVSEGVWYVRAWLGADQIKKRLAVLFDSRDELSVHELGRADSDLATRLEWQRGRLEDEEINGDWPTKRGMWTALQSAVQGFARH